MREKWNTESNGFLVYIILYAKQKYILYKNERLLPRDFRRKSRERQREARYARIFREYFFLPSRAGKPVAVPYARASK